MWRREVVRFFREKLRILGSIAGPLAFLLVFGSGLSGAIGPLAEGETGASIDFEQFMFPGIIAMSVFIGALFNAVSIIEDRQVGVLKEMLVAPVSRAGIAFGKTLGAATVATMQGTLVFVFAPLVDIRLSVILVLKMWPLMFLGAFALASMGVAIGSRMRSTQSFQVVNQFLTFPLIFLSGIFFPVRDLPAWMDILVRVNPVSYAVDPLRRIVFEAQGVSDEVLGDLAESGLGLSIAGHQLTVAEDAAIVAIFGIAMCALAMWLVSLRD